MTDPIMPMNGHCNLPAAFAGLNDYPQFIIWRREWNALEGKWTKRPTSPHTGRTCDSQDPKEWLDYEGAYAACLRHKADGVGFVFTVSDPFWFLDLDHHFKDGAWSKRATSLSALLSGAAIEVSSSGDGLHIIGTGARPAHGCVNKLEALELYSHGRFCALTFTSCSGDVMCDKSAEITQVAEGFFPPGVETDVANWTDEPAEDWGGPVDDDALIKKLLRSRSVDSILGSPDGKAAVTFRDLWECNEDVLAERWPDRNRSFDHSGADQSLAVRLARATGNDCERVERLMRDSQLARDKWELRPHWLRVTILKACALVGDTYWKKKPQPPPVIPPPPRPGHATDDLGAGAMLADKSNHLYLEMMLRGLAQSIQYDEFSSVILLNGEKVTDNAARQLFMDLRATIGMPVTRQLFDEVFHYMAWKNRFHPMREYFDTCQPAWDGVDRCETWLIDAAGADDTPFVRAVSRIFLVAAVRRVRDPGCKYDELLTLEGPQGLLKSSMLLALCPRPEFFTDCITLGMSSKELMENLQGVLIAEIPELNQFGTSAIAHVKAMLSRQRDKARLAYAHYPDTIGRQCVMAGTVNEDDWLRDPTGNRRFWPVRCHKHADIAWIEANRDQLWAEAAAREMAGESIRLEESLWAAAGAEQAKRMADDPFADVLDEKLGDLHGFIGSSLIWTLLGVPIERRPAQQKRMGDAMRRNGWERKKLTGFEGRGWKYWRGHHESEITLETVSGAMQGQLADVVPIMPVKETGK